jgi:hypothetical protein
MTGSVDPGLVDPVWPGGVQIGGVAQLGEHLLCKQGVTGSIPVVSTILPVCLSPACLSRVCLSPVRAAVMRPASFVVQSAVVCLQTMTAAPIWLNPLGRPSGLNLGAQTWGQELAASIVCIAECPVFGLITWLRQSVLGCGSGRLNDCPVFSVGAVVFVLLKCESGSGASLGACDGNLSFGAGGHPVVQPTCLTGSVVRENSTPTVGWRGFRGAMNDLTRWILWRSRKRAVRWPTGERSCVRGKHIYFQGSSLYPEDGFCAW